MNDDDLVSRDHASRLFKCDTRTIKAALADTPPDEAEPGKPKCWRLSTINAALDQRAVTHANYIRDGSASSTASLTRARTKLARNKPRLAELQR